MNGLCLLGAKARFFKAAVRGPPAAHAFGVLVPSSHAQWQNLWCCNLARGLSPELLATLCFCFDPYCSCWCPQVFLPKKAMFPLPVKDGPPQGEKQHYRFVKESF